MQLPLPPERAAALRLLLRYTTISRARAESLLQPEGLQLAGGVVQRLAAEELADLLKAAQSQPPGPHVAAAWERIESGLPRPGAAAGAPGPPVAVTRSRSGDKRPATSRQAGTFPGKSQEGAGRDAADVFH